MYARELSSDNDYSLAAIERDLLNPLNLKFKRDKSGKIADLKSSRAGVEGSLAIENIEPESYTPKQLLRALDDASRVEKEFMKTGERRLSAGENPRKNDIDFERATILANLLIGDSLETLAARGLHGNTAGNREDKINAVIDYLYKGSYGRDLYTDTPILGAESDQGHLESNSRGGVRLRPELSLINQMLGDSEGIERLKRIEEARRRINAAGYFEESMLNDKDIANLMQYKDFQKMVKKQPNRAVKYGFKRGEDSMPIAAAASPNYLRMAGEALRQLIGGNASELTTGNISRDKPIVVNADEGANVFVHTNGKNGNGHSKMQGKFSDRLKRMR